MSTRPASAAIRPNATVIESGNGKILCVADIRGKISALNQLAKESNAVAIIHTGDFGFFGTTRLAISRCPTALTSTTYRGAKSAENQ